MYTCITPTQELFEMLTIHMRNDGEGFSSEALQRLDEEVFVKAVQRLAQVKKEKMPKGLLLAFGPISRWASSCNVQRLELLRRQHAIAALTHVCRELVGAAGHLHDSIQLEDLQVSVFEALGWLCGSESGSHAVASEVIQAEAAAAAAALEASIAKFPENRRSKVLGLAAVSWCLHQASSDRAEAGSAVPGSGEGEARVETVKTILDSLAESSNGDLQTLALLGFGWVSFSHPPSGLALLQSNGVQLMVSAMQRHPLNRRLQYYACGTVSWLAGQETNRKVPVSRFVTDAGGVEAMVAASRLHIQDWNLQIACSMALCSIVSHGGPGVLQTIVSFGAVEAIVEAVRHNRHVPKMQEAGKNSQKSTSMCVQMYVYTHVHIYIWAHTRTTMEAVRHKRHTRHNRHIRHIFFFVWVMCHFTGSARLV